MCAGITLMILVRAGAAMAGDPAGAAAAPGSSGLNTLPGSHAASAAAFAFPESYSMPHEPAAQAFRAHDFRALGSGLSNAEPTPAAADDALMHDTMVWHRLADFRAFGRLQRLK